MFRGDFDSDSELDTTIKVLFLREHAEMKGHGRCQTKFTFGRWHFCVRREVTNASSVAFSTAHASKHVRYVASTITNTVEPLIAAETRQGIVSARYFWCT